MLLGALCCDSTGWNIHTWENFYPGYRGLGFEIFKKVRMAKQDVGNPISPDDLAHFWMFPKNNIPNKASTHGSYAASSGPVIPKGCGRGMKWLSEQGAGVAQHWVMGILFLWIFMTERERIDLINFDRPDVWSSWRNVGHSCLFLIPFRSAKPRLQKLSFIWFYNWDFAGSAKTKDFAHDSRSRLCLAPFLRHPRSNFET